MKHNKNDRQRQVPEPRIASALKDARRMDEIEKQRGVQAAAAGWQTRRRNEAERPRGCRTRDARPLRFYVPARLDPATVPAPLRWYVCYFCSTVHLHWVRRWKWRYKKGERGWVHLCHRLLRKVIPEKHIAEVIKLLLDRGVVECDGVFGNGKSRGYRLTETYRQTGVVVCDDAAFSAKVRKVYAYEERDRQPVHHALRQDLERVVFDLDRAKTIIATLKPKRKKRKVPYATPDYRRDLTDHCTVLANGDHYLIVDRYGRVHTSVTSTSKRVLKFLYLRDENGVPRPVVWIDIVNSQPLFIGILARQYLGGTKDVRYKMRNVKFGGKDPYRAADQALRARPILKDEQYPSNHGGYYPPQNTKTPGTQPPSQPPTQYQHTEQHTSRMLPSPITTHLGYNTPETNQLRKGYATTGRKDLDEYVHLCEQGLIYEELMVNKRDAGERRRVKRRFLVAFYRDPDGKRKRFPNRMWQRIRGRFPGVAGFVEEVKRKDYRHAPWLMQNYEATVMIRRVCGRLKRERPEVPLLTKHDSIGTTPEHTDYVREVIRDEFGKLGVSVKLKKEVYT